MKRNLKATVVILLLLAILTGCGADAPPPEPDTTENTVLQNPTTEPAVTEPVTTAKENEVPAETEATEPLETVPVTEATEPEVTEPAQTEPAVTAPPKEDPKPEPTVPAVKPEPTKPTEPSTPKPTKPKPTTPPATEPAKHTHQYTAKVVKPTCTKGGYTVHTCSCGDSYTDSKTAPGEHSYNKETVKPTMWQQGYTVYTCTVCSDSYKDDYVNISSSDRKAFIEEVRAATVKHLNKLRVKDGSTSASTLQKLTKVADYRAKQLQSNFSHSVPDLREALAYYEYGRYIAPEDWDPSEYYYDFPGTEAIGKGNWVGTADEIGEGIAKGFRNSAGHWSYVGSSEYPYMAVGISYDPSAIGISHWKICVFVSSTDQYG